MKKLMTGNEAVALGAYEAGVKVCTAYPGTPSTEVTENLKGYDDIYVEWSINEKVAVDVAVGASMVGARAIVSMKHQGLNVASDTFQTLGFYGVRGGVVIVVSDDVGCSSSNSEQDNRINAKYACVAMLEPTDSQEAKDFTRLAFRISEELDTPVLLRLTTRVSHSTSLVELTEEREDFTYTGFDKESFKYGIVGALALARHKENIERKSKWVPYSEESPLNRIEWGDTSIGIITSGISYQYVKEVLPSASILKLGFTYPLPRRLIYEFASKVRNLYVVEEGEPYIEEQVSAMNIRVIGKEIFPLADEFTPDTLIQAFSKVLSPIEHREFWEKVTEVEPEITEVEQKMIPRPPVFCTGCPHRASYEVLRKMNVIGIGDIGCYGVGIFPPVRATHAAVVMGASIGAATGITKASVGHERDPVVAVIGDSTFLHSGMTPLLNAVYSKSDITVIILDNLSTAMTGFQPHPATGYDIKGNPVEPVSLENICRTLGVRRVKVIDPVDQKKLKKMIKEETAIDEVSVIITRRKCALIDKKEKPFIVNMEKCIGCGKCLEIYCPAIESVDGTISVKGKTKEVKKAEIDENQCTGCALCFNLCKPKAIERKE